MRIRFLFLLALAAALIIPAAATARTLRVVPFKTVAGVPLRLTPSQVRHRLGRPSHTVRVSGKVAEYDYQRFDLAIEFDTDHHPDRSDFVGVAVGPAVRDIRYHTVHGIHIGSTKAAVRKAFGARLKCDLETCSIYEGKPGAIGSTTFGVTFEQGRVAEMANQYVFKDF